MSVEESLSINLFWGLCPGWKINLWKDVKVTYFIGHQEGQMWLWKVGIYTPALCSNFLIDILVWQCHRGVIGKTTEGYLRHIGCVFLLPHSQMAHSHSPTAGMFVTLVFPLPMGAAGRYKLLPCQMAWRAALQASVFPKTTSRKQDRVHWPQKATVKSHLGEEPSPFSYHL